MIRQVLSLVALSFASVSFFNDLIYNNQHKTFIMTNCNSQKFPSTCQESTLIKTFHNTGEVIRYQEIDPISVSLLDGVVLRQENGKYYKAIYTENTINVEWYRCTYPTDLVNGTGDKVMLTKAINTAGYLGATLRFDAKEYILNEQLSFVDISCFKLLGDKQHTVIKSNSNQRFNSYYLKFTNCNNLVIDGIRINQNKSNLQVYTQADYDNAGNELMRDFNGGIYITDSTDIEVTNCSFLDLYTRGLQFYGCNEGDIKVTHNYFESEIQTQMYRMEHLGLTQSHNVNFTVENNIFKNKVPRDGSGNPIPNPDQMPCGIFAFDCGLFGLLFINNNYFEFCGRNNTGHHRLYAIDFYDNVNNFVMTNNVFRNTTWGAIRFDSTRKNAVISNNIIHQLIADDSGIINSSTRGSQVEFKNILISNNTIETSSDQSFGIILQSQYDNIISDNINILNNTFNKLKRIITVIGNISSINISSNIASDVRGPAVVFEAYTSNNVFDSSGNITSSTHKVTSTVGNVLINNNNFKSIQSGEGFVGILINGVTIYSQSNLDIYKNFTKRFVISNNLIFGNTQGYGITINSINEFDPMPSDPQVIAGNSLDGKVTISNNEISDVGRGLYLRCHKTIAKDNILFNCTINAILEDYTDNIKFQNYYNNTPI